MVSRIKKKVKKILRNWLFSTNEITYFKDNLIGKYELDVVSDGIFLDAFKRDVSPKALSFNTLSKVLILAPHQDDEAIGCGGLMLELKSKNIDFKVVFLTDGRQGFDNMKAESSVNIRENEARDALSTLNIEIDFLNINNSDFGNIADRQLELAKIINDYKPDTILHPWILDYPVKHRVCNTLLFSILKSNTKSYQIWGYQVHNNIFFNSYLDITYHINDKVEMIRKYKSQIDNVQDYDFITKNMNGFNSKYISSLQNSFIELYHCISSEEYCMIMYSLYNRKDYYKGYEKIFKIAKSIC